MQVFISHAQADKTLVSKLASELKKSGLEVWSESEILPGDNWAAEANKALQASEAMIVLLTPASLRSDQVRREIEYALGDKKFSHRLIPVIVGSASDFAHEDIPWILRSLKPINVPKHGQQAEPIKQIVRALTKAA
jgi:hypothetical protein